MRSVIFSQCRTLYDHCLPTVILIIIGIPSPTHSFTLGLNPSFSANPPYRSLSFFSFRIHCMDFPDCLLLLLSISIFLLFSFFLFLHFLVVGSVQLIKLTFVGFRAHVKIASRTVSYRIVATVTQATTYLCTRYIVLSTTTQSCTAFFTSTFY